MHDPYISTSAYLYIYLSYMTQPLPGAPCTPFSNMGLGQGEDDEVFTVHKKYYSEVGSSADVAVLENVPECSMKEHTQHELGCSWDIETMPIDPRLFGLGCSRARLYGLAWKKDMYQWNPSITLAQIIDALKARPVMTANSFFYLSKTPSLRLTEAEES